jgi:hypothetical protein
MARLVSHRREVNIGTVSVPVNHGQILKILA